MTENSVHELFSEYFSMTESEMETIWKNSLFVLDTNIYIDLFRYSDTTREHWIKVIDEIQDKLWVPNQVAFEYLENYNSGSVEQAKYYDFAIQEIAKRFQSLWSYIYDIEAKDKEHPHLKESNIQSILNTLTELKNTGMDRLKNALIEQKKAVVDLKPIINTLILDFISGKVNGHISDADFAEYFNEAQKRHECLIPPGFIDSRKKANTKSDSMTAQVANRKNYGDFIIWKEILEKAKNAQINILFITSDSKEDWWEKDRKGNIKNFRKELLQEFRKETRQKIHSFLSTDFLGYSGKMLKIVVERSVAEEVESAVIIGDTIRLFVGNLDWGTTTDDLKKAFTDKRIHVVSEILVTDRFSGRSKGFGYVDLPQGVDEAYVISQMDGIILNGRKMIVNKVRPPKPREPRSRY